MLLDVKKYKLRNGKLGIGFCLELFLPLLSFNFAVLCTQTQRSASEVHNVPGRYDKIQICVNWSNK